MNPSLPLVVQQTSTLGRLLCGVGGFLVLMSLGFWLWQPDAGRVLVGPLALSGGLGVLLGGLMLRRPARLILTPEGLRLETFMLRRQKSWPWPQVSAFDLGKVWAGRQRVAAICFTAQEAGQPLPQSLPTYWQRPAAEVVELLNQARDRWR